MKETKIPNGCLRQLKNRVIWSNARKFNGRYSLNQKAVKEAFLAKSITERLTNHTFFGEVGNNFTSETNTAAIAFCITKLKFKKDQVLADIDVLDTPAGKVLDEAITNCAAVRFRTVWDAECKTIEQAEALVQDKLHFVKVYVDSL